MNFMILSIKVANALGKHFAKYGKGYIKILIGIGIGTTIGATACAIVFKKLENKHRKDIAEKLQKEFARKVKELEEKYKHNEFVLKQKINDLCDEFGIDHVC